jgi:hypothetical protein
MPNDDEATEPSAPSSSDETGDALSEPAAD